MSKLAVQSGLAAGVAELMLGKGSMLRVAVISAFAGGLKFALDTALAFGPPVHHIMQHLPDLKAPTLAKSYFSEMIWGGPSDDVFKTFESLKNIYDDMGSSDPYGAIESFVLAYVTYMAFSPQRKFLKSVIAMISYPLLAITAGAFIGQGIRKGTHENEIGSAKKKATIKPK